MGDIIMPVIGAVTGGLDFSNHFIPLSKSVTSPVLSEAKKQGAVTGNFLRAALQGATAPRLPSFRDTLRRVVDLFSAAVQARAFSTDLHSTAMSRRSLVESSGVTGASWVKQLRQIIGHM